MYLNKAFIYGNLTRDPELKSLPSGTPVTTFGLATNRVFTNKDGGKQEQTDFHNIVVFGRQAETVAQYLRKGSGALVEGRITTRSWQGEDGAKRYRTEIIADRVQFGPRAGGAGSGAGSPSSGTSSSPSKSGGEEKVDTIQYPDAEDEGINPDDIPF